MPLSSGSQKTSCITLLCSGRPMASFGLATALGYGDVISNRVVDAIGDISGKVRLHEKD